MNTLQIYITFQDKCKPDELSGSIDDLPARFEHLLHKATQETPIWIFLDSLDSLACSDEAHSFHWLPEVLPPYCKIVLSTRQKHDDCKLMEKLEAKIPNLRRWEIMPNGERRYETEGR